MEKDMKMKRKNDYVTANTKQKRNIKNADVIAFINYQLRNNGTPNSQEVDPNIFSYTWKDYMKMLKVDKLTAIQIENDTKLFLKDIKEALIEYDKCRVTKQYQGVKIQTHHNHIHKDNSDFLSNLIDLIKLNLNKSYHFKPEGTGKTIKFQYEFIKKISNIAE